MLFLGLKALSFLPFGNFLRGTMGKLLLIGIVLAAVAFAIWKWKESIREEAYNQIYSQQAEQLIKEQQEEFRRMQEVIEKGNKIQSKTVEDRHELILEIEKLRNEARTAPSEKDGEVAPVLKETIESIREIENRQPEKKTVGEKVGEAVDETVSTGNKAIDAWKKKVGGNE